jgi:hypothetical protein
MAEIKTCPECGVPEQVTSDHVWLNSGVVVQRSNETTRISFIESENLDPLYDGIGKIIGIPIDRLVIDIARRGTGSYVRNMTPPAVKDMIQRRELGLDMIVDVLITTAQLCGYGKYESMGFRYEGDEDDYLTIRVAEPYSLPLTCGAHAGACEAIADTSHGVIYKEMSPGVYEIKAYISKHPEELEKRLQVKPYHHRDGDIELERCATCGGPAVLSGYRWHLDRGVIVNTWTARRMVLVGPHVIDPVFEELKKELGEAIPAAVVEAQRRFVKSGLYSIEEIGDEGDLRTQIAVRGMGNLREIKIGAKGLSMRIDNAANHLMTVGLAQGLFEMAFDVESHVEWEVSAEGDLSVEITPRTVMVNA